MGLYLRPFFMGCRGQVRRRPGRTNEASHDSGRRTARFMYGRNAVDNLRGTCGRRATPRKARL